MEYLNLQFKITFLTNCECFEKIIMSDMAFLLNKGRYIRDQNYKEIEYMDSLRIPIYKYG